MNITRIGCVCDKPCTKCFSVYFASIFPRKYSKIVNYNFTKVVINTLIAVLLCKFS